MAPKKKNDHELGTVEPHAEGWRVVVKLAGTLHCGPRRNVRSCADDDLVAMRAVPRTEMAAHLAQLKTIGAQARIDAAADAASLPAAPIPSMLEAFLFCFRYSPDWDRTGRTWTDGTDGTD